MNPPPTPNADGRRRPKAVLFCPTCGHESRPDGDWDVRERRGRAALVCPDCDTTVAPARRAPRIAD